MLVSAGAAGADEGSSFFTAGASFFLPPVMIIARRSTIGFLPSSFTTNGEPMVLSFVSRTSILYVPASKPRSRLMTKSNFVVSQT